MSNKKHNRENTLVIFDVDGTLTKPRNPIKKDMLDMLVDLRKKVTVCFVGGSDLKKQKEQMGENCLDLFDYCFPQNGVIAYKGSEKFAETSFVKRLGEEKMKKLINYILVWISQCDIPIKRGTFVEFRTSMLNVSPIGRSCSQKEREDFYELCNKTGIRKKLVSDLEKEFSDFNLKFSIGGQISIDIFPQGWDKTYCLQYFKDMKKLEYIYFFGDKTSKGGNDYEIFIDDRTIGKSVKSPAETIKILKELFY